MTFFVFFYEKSKHILKKGFLTRAGFNLRTVPRIGCLCQGLKIRFADFELRSFAADGGFGPDAWGLPAARDGILLRGPKSRAIRLRRIAWSFAADGRFGPDARGLNEAGNGILLRDPKSRKTPCPKRKAFWAKLQAGDARGGGGPFWSRGACFVWGAGWAREVSRKNLTENRKNLTLKF
jgi:hypothetical protein